MWKKLFEPVDMTVGDPVRQIVKFMIPMLIGNVFQQLYNTVDSIVVGKFIGDNALTTFTGQNIGAGQIDRVETGAKKGAYVAVYHNHCRSACSSRIYHDLDDQVA